jgi:hypothetical protein
MTYEIGTQIGDMTITDYSDKSYYTLKCKCGTTITGSAQIVSYREKQLEQFGYAACKLCMNKFKRSTISDIDLYKPIYNRYKREAKRRGYFFSLTLKESIELFKSNCHYCGIKPSNTSKIGMLNITYQGIDRMEQEVGYCTTNVVPCCKTCNFAKHKLSYKEFIDHIEKIYYNVQRPSETSEYTRSRVEAEGTLLK